jgi:hypothetical protein
MTSPCTGSECSDCWTAGWWDAVLRELDGSGSMVLLLVNGEGGNRMQGR